MRFRQYISSVLVVVMLCMQGMVAHHYKAHVQGEERIAAYLRHSAEGHLGQKPKHDTRLAADTLCEICLFAKHFSETAFAAHIAFDADFTKYQTVVASGTALPLYSKLSAYIARAPPTVIS